MKNIHENMEEIVISYISKDLKVTASNLFMHIFSIRRFQPWSGKGGSFMLVRETSLSLAQIRTRSTVFGYFV